MSGGPQAHLKGLRDHDQPLIDDLRCRLLECVEIDETAGTGDELSKAMDEYRKRGESVGRSLY